MNLTSIALVIWTETVRHNTQDRKPPTYAHDVTR